MDKKFAKGGVNCGSGGAVYGLGFIGAAIYYISTTFFRRKKKNIFGGGLF